ncbi:hypothetical protein ACIA8C_41550 [Nocardia sp. NPDC051321]|uniref:hypothetical protein n=1 Tax=Nocardia sp. NPDC051321 TaxID=3364323 RepID=UPI0037AC954B
MTPTEGTERTTGRQAPIFGVASFTATAVGMVVNAIPILINPYLIFWLVIVYLVETLLAAVLILSGGRARSLGVGIFISLLGVLAAVGGTALVMAIA